MFTGLTTLLFGSPERQEPIDQEPSSLKSKCPRKLKTKEDDDGWVVVTDKKRREARSSNTVVAEPAEATHISDDSEEEWETNMSMSLNSSTDQLPGEVPESVAPSPVPPVSCPTPSTPSSLTQLDPDGSWYLTPPPCFTAGSGAGNSTFVSPMENLLIEHPSMSVYQWDEPSVDEGASPSPKAPPAEEVLAVRPRAVRTRTDVEHPKKTEVARRRERPRRASSIASRAGLFFAQITSGETEDKQLQLKRQMHDGSKGCRRNQLERNNKVREFIGIGKKLRRKDKMKNPSGMNNNRKC